MNICLRSRFTCICVIAATVQFAAIGGCSSPAGSAGTGGPHPAGAGAGLVGTTWIAEDIRGRGVIDKVQSTLIFDTAEAVNGSGGCNRYFGPVAIAGETIVFGALAATRMGCPAAIADQEEKFFAALAETRRFRVDPRGLLFLYGEVADAPILRFSR